METLILTITEDQAAILTDAALTLAMTSLDHSADEKALVLEVVDIITAHFLAIEERRNAEKELLAAQAVGGIN